MSHSFSFGKHQGKSYEWCFFNAPWYARWIYEKDIYSQGHLFSGQEAEHFLELYRRASHLAGQCEQCTKPFTRMGLTTLVSRSVTRVGFYCDGCEYLGGSKTAYEPPSFFVEGRRLSRKDQKMITREIQRQYIQGNLTQTKMETFFGNEEHFADCTAGFYEDITKQLVIPARS